MENLHVSPSCEMLQSTEEAKLPLDLFIQVSEGI